MIYHSWGYDQHENLTIFCFANENAHNANAIPFHWKPKVKEQLDSMIQKDIIEPIPLNENPEWSWFQKKDQMNRESQLILRV